jgi:hypothetical protein
MKLATYLVNSTRKEYVIIGNDYPNKIGLYLLELEKNSNWNLRLDDIHIRYTSNMYDYIDVKSHIYNRENGGEIIDEIINLWK